MVNKANYSLVSKNKRHLYLFSFVYVPFGFSYPGIIIIFVEIGFTIKQHNCNMKNSYLKNYEQPEAEELSIVLESTILSGDGNVENPDDPGTEIDI